MNFKILAALALALAASVAVVRAEDEGSQNLVVDENNANFDEAQLDEAHFDEDADEQAADENGDEYENE